MIETTLSPEAALDEFFSDLERVYPTDARLLRGTDKTGRPCFVIVEPGERIFVVHFDSEAERTAWFDEVFASAQKTIARRCSDEDDNNSGPAPVVARPLGPRSPVSAGAGTILEALTEQ